MNPEIKQKWLEALRSGKYKQGRGLLRDSKNQFCCLGVLCDIIKPNGWRLSPHTIPIPTYSFLYGDGAAEFVLRNNVLKYVGMTDVQHDALVNLNDNGKTFDEIADYIEANL